MGIIKMMVVTFTDLSYVDVEIEMKSTKRNVLCFCRLSLSLVELEMAIRTKTNVQSLMRGSQIEGVIWR